jgi:hypothetical protein
MGSILHVSAAQSKKVILKPDRTYKKYDITGDGKVDKIQINQGKKEYDFYHKISINVNGKKVYEKSRIYYDELRAELYTLKNKQVIVYLFAVSENGCGPVCGLFIYQGNKLKQLVDFTDFYAYGAGDSGSVIKVSGNSLDVDLYSMTWSMGYVDFSYRFTYKNGKMVRTSKTAKIIRSSAGDSSTWLTPLWNIQLYKGATSNSKAFVLKKGTKVQVKSCYIDGKKIRFYAKLKNGKSGWFDALKQYKFDPIYGGMFAETRYSG